MNVNYQYNLTKPFSIGLKALLCMVFLLTIGRWYSAFDTDFVIINSEIHFHVSNLSLSMIVYLGIGHSWLLSGMKFGFITILGFLIIVGNFICETLMGFMNTTDILDAIYGTVGVAIVFIFLAITKKYGMIPAKPEKL